MTPRVVLADRSSFVRLAVREALGSAGITVVAEASAAAEALSAIAELAPDAVLLDAELDDGHFAVLAAAHRAQPAAAFIVLSPDDSADRALLAVRAGACGFLPKDTPPERLADTVRGALAGEAAIPRVLIRRMLERMALRDVGEAVPPPRLTPRERDVLERVAQGLPDREIGAALGISEITVRRHTAAAARKLRVRRRTEAVAAFRSSAV